MKKLISLLMILAVLLSLCACGGQTNEPSNEPAVDPTEETTEDSGLLVPEVKPSKDYTPEELYGHIDQTKPNDKGVYKLWSKDGVANMANVPDGTFELLCSIDMEGASISPIGTADVPFTGKIDGKNYIISNFTLTSEGEALGFVGVNEGTIQDLQLEGITATAAAANQYIGTMAGINNGTILRSKSSGTLTVDAAAADAEIGGAIGQNTGSFTNAVVTVDVLASNAAAATVGGIVGTTNGGKVEFVESYGAITVTGENKTVGLFAGSSVNTPINNCVFVGADNSLNGELFTNLTNTSDMSLVTACSMRDNTPVVIPEEQMKLRQIVVDKMYEMVTAEWHVETRLATSDGGFGPANTYYGMPYQHRNGTYEAFQYVVGDDGYVEDWAYDIPLDLLNSYFGSNCMSTLRQAYYMINNTGLSNMCLNMYPWMPYTGWIPVGDLQYDQSLGTSDSIKHCEVLGEQAVYEAYAMLRIGDCYMYQWPDVGAHVRMVAANAVVVRNQDGTINPLYSYVTSHESGYTTHDTVNHTYTQCRVNYNYTFANLFYDGALPYTIEELVTGVMEPATAEFVSATDGKMGLVTGAVKANYAIAYVDMAITDSKGNVFYEHRMFPSVNRQNVEAQALAMATPFEFQMGRFATPLSKVNFVPGETYSYTISVTTTPGDTFQVHEGTFTQGAGE